MMYSAGSGNAKSQEKIQYCAITEQGDLGLGVEVLTDKDQEIMNKKKTQENKNNK